MTETIDIEYLRGWIGRRETIADLVSADLARKYHATFDLPGNAPAPGEIVPRLIHFCLGQPAVPTTGLGDDGHPKRGGFLPPVPLQRRMWAGGSLVFHGDLRVGDTVERVSSIDDVVLKEGRTGTLCFVTVSHRIEVAGTLMIEERQDLVYRGMDAAGAAAKTLPPADPGEHRQEMKAETPLLFRYSALTFNGHRIHYDRSYATGVEGYPGLVVHGPMQAAMLLNYAAKLRGEPPARFGFRGLSPLFEGETFTLNASSRGDRLNLWTAKQNGPVCMSAEAVWA